MSLARTLAKRLLPGRAADALKRASRTRQRLDRLEAAVGRLARAQFPSVAAATGTLADHELSLFSQNGEDGVLLHLLWHVGATDRRFVEIGIGDGRENNTASLAVHFGWTGLMFDGNAAGVASAQRFFDGHPAVGPGRVTVRESFVTRENVNDLIRGAGVGGGVDVFSLDIDGIDYHVWDALDAIAPRLVVVEYNASFGRERAVAVPYDPGFDRLSKHPSGWYHSASLMAFERLGRRKGYALLGTDAAGVNAFFARRELLVPPLREVSAADAYRPHASRLSVASVERQWQTIAHLPLVAVE